LNHLRPLFESLNSHGVEYLVIGGVAAIAYGVPRLTLDVDIVIRSSAHNASALLRALENAGLATAALTSPDEFPAHEVTIFKDRVRVDVQTRTPGIDFDSAFVRRKTVDVAGTVIPLMRCSSSGHEAQVRERLFWLIGHLVDVSGRVVGQRFRPPTSFIVSHAPAPGAAGVELGIEESDPTLDLSAPTPQQFPVSCGVLDLPVRARGCRDRDPLFLELHSLALPRPEGVVTQEMTHEVRLEKCIEPLHVVSVSWDLLDEGDSSARSEDEMLADAVEPALQRGAVAVLGESVEAFFLARPDRTADVDRMGVDDEKGGAPSPPNSQKAWESFFMSGVSRARRSAQLGRESRRGKRRCRTGCRSNQE
jgi:hypothetical protein